MKTKLAIAACALFMSCASYAQTFDVPAGAPGYIENPSWDIKAGLPKSIKLSLHVKRRRCFLKLTRKDMLGVR